MRKTTEDAESWPSQERIVRNSSLLVWKRILQKLMCHVLEMECAPLLGVSASPDTMGTIVENVLQNTHSLLENAKKFIDFHSCYFQVLLQTELMHMSTTESLLNSPIAPVDLPSGRL